MTYAKFFQKNGQIVSFEISGHTGFSVEGEDILCAAVSSAVYMAANTITDVLNQKADIRVDDSNGYFSFSLSNMLPENEKNIAMQVVLKGLLLHLSGLEEQYKQYLTIQLTEV